MPVKDPDVAFVKSGGSTNTNPNLSLGGDASTITNGRNFVDNFLHNAYDEVAKTESVSGDTEYRHFYYRNRKPYKVKNVRLSVLADETSEWSKVEFAKGTANNGFVEPAIIDENTAPVGISDSDWKVPSATNPLNLGDVEAGSTASFWSRRKVEAGALIEPLEKVTIMIIVDPTIAPPDPEECPTGQHYDTATQQCVDDPEPPDNSCPEGQHRNENNVCVPNTGQPCPNGQILVNGQCIDPSTPPPPTPVTIVTSADFGCGVSEEIIAWAGTIQQATLAQNKGFLFVANGDLSYTSSINCFMDMLDENGLIERTKITLGNHDDEEDESSRIRDDYIREFQIPSVGYYATTIQNIHCIFMDTQSNYALNSPQYIAIKADLQAASLNAGIDWIIVFYHKPSMSNRSNHAALTDFRDIYHPLFDQYKVDVIVSGHNHNLQRSFPCKYNASSPSNPIIVDNTQLENIIYTPNLDGRVFIVCGAGGRSLHDVTALERTQWSFVNDGVFGFIDMTWTNNNRDLTVSFFEVTDAEHSFNIHQFTLRKTNT